MKKVLVAVLDWGLGHASRCIPIIRLLEEEGMEVHVGGNGSSLLLLKKEFPHLKFLDLPAYAPSYPRKGNMAAAMLKQIPKFIKAIRQEYIVTKTYVKHQGIDVVISDNRYGCRCEDVPSVIITHQSNVMMPRRFGFLRGIVRYMVIRLLSRFDVCWLPDDPQHQIAGTLTAFGKVPPSLQVGFIGILSRFQRSAHTTPPALNVLAVCSGPEPQRTLLEEILLPQLQLSGLRFLLVRGVVEEEAAPREHVVNYLTSEALQEMILQSDVIISRSGYSTVMDLCKLGKKAIFIPTPGQTEQEYLADTLMKKRWTFSMPQDEFDLKKALVQSADYTGLQIVDTSDELLREAIRSIS